MIRRLRSRLVVPLAYAGTWALFFVVCAVALAGQQTPLPTGGPTPHDLEQERNVLLLLGSTILVVCGYVTWLFSYHVKQQEKRLPELVAIAAASALTGHNEDEHAHPAASEHAHEPLFEELDAMRETLAEVVRKHTGCAFYTGNRRDPADSPHARRADDPDGFDGRPMRGRK